MNPEPSEFESLRRLLKLKRYEQPPPRYFNEFSGQVLQRLRAGRAGSRRDAGESPAPAWLQRLLAAFRNEPMLAGGCASLVLLVLVAGAMYSERPEEDPAAVSFGGVQAAVPATAGAGLGAVSPFGVPSTNADSSLSGTTLFDIGVKAQPVVGRPPGQ